MGCDIHLAVEVRRDGRWEYLPDAERICHNCEGGGLLIEDRFSRNDDFTPKQCWWCDGTGWYVAPFYVVRNYVLFAALAGVRNYWDISPVAAARGWPDDVAEATRNLPSNRQPCPPDADPPEHDRWWDECDLHDISWLTVRELLDYDWDQLVEWTDAPPLPRLARGAKEDNRAIIDRYCAAPKVKYRQSLMPSVREYWLPALLRIAALGAPDDVRIVFAFDN